MGGSTITLLETNIAPENGWLEDEIPFEMAYFQGKIGLLLLVSGSVGNCTLPPMFTFVGLMMSIDLWPTWFTPMMEIAGGFGKWHKWTRCEPWESKTKQRMVFRMIHVKDSLLPMGKVWSNWTSWVKGVMSNMLFFLVGSLSGLTLISGGLKNQTASSRGHAKSTK